MNKLQIFNFEELSVRTMSIDGEPYFVGKDVAEILGYKKTANAINKHVDDEDKGVTKLGTPGGVQDVTIINESGLYSLIFSSKLESAKRFKRWVTSEVLPTLRKTGTYQVPDNPMDALKLMFQAQEETKEEINSVKADVIDLKENQKLDSGEYGLVTRTVNQRVAYIRQIHGLPNKKEINTPLYKDINNDIHVMAGIKTRTQLKQKHFNDVLDMIANWFPSQSTMYVVKQLEMKFEEEL
ncbi:ORF6C domain-containing protein [Staphylococcus hominis]|mgnify:FL=1|uniref:BRO family protein n=1 Tax=Staphylococcus hominis TaxID=1290 RepID=UPI000F0BAD1B|nr:BRO family protein [Staphylococcus hominis]DAL43002.1 MAG TPA_asm: repressor domain protein [Caudoviricetes sp.]MBC3067147.1 ORF6C domain-containing protein [Staphylococcus hominis]MBC3073624.1 ORF6C domain-containing protein [Staphylococcus hominis]MCI2872929.1 ORF6C domain-containing protein [Staphylococcus hominis]MDS3895720.1 BRO family protein [Staphylococcus hominis]